MTPAEIIEKRFEIARLLCARQIKMKTHPTSKMLKITDIDLDNVPQKMLDDMVRRITP